jgi:UDP-GlcNAc:undecaprenyl-phosphate GlcNAc-1-phosphate transferase
MKPFILVIAFIVAVGLSVYLTSVIRQAALRFGIVDRPDGNLKNHDSPVPYLGGIAIYLSFLLALGFAFTFTREVLGLLLAGTIVLLLGLIDDLGFLKPVVKFGGQIIAVLVLVKSGIMIKLEFLPMWVSLPLTFLWLIGLCNAFNIIDIMDGLAAGVGLIACSFFVAVALLNGRITIAVMAVTLAGSLLGFLKYNGPPARIYMGDTGSMFMGLIIGALAMIGSYTERNILGFWAPVVILGVPIFDTFLVMYLRWRKGLSLFLGSPDHYALRLKTMGLSVRQVLLLSYLAAVLLGGVGLLIMQASSVSVVAAILAVLAVIAIVTISLLQRAEVR